MAAYWWREASILTWSSQDCSPIAPALGRPNAGASNHKCMVSYWVFGLSLQIVSLLSIKYDSLIKFPISRNIILTLRSAQGFNDIMAIIIDIGSSRIAMPFHGRALVGTMGCCHPRMAGGHPLIWWFVSLPSPPSYPIWFKLNSRFEIN